MTGTSSSVASQLQLSQNLTVVDIAKHVICRDPTRVLVTYALGSCIAVVAYDPESQIGGMIHYMLPESKVDKVRAETMPAMFGDTGLPRLFKELYAAGAKKENMVTYIVGGASTLDCEGNFNIGKRNALLARKLFWKSGINVKHEDTGGKDSRTVFLSMSDGLVVIKQPGGKEQEL